jgi:hypothetical protein
MRVSREVQKFEAIFSIQILLGMTAKQVQAMSSVKFQVSLHRQRDANTVTVYHQYKYSPYTIYTRFTKHMKERMLLQVKGDYCGC